jgi:hypothetical protein
MVQRDLSGRMKTGSLAVVAVARPDGTQAVSAGILLWLPCSLADAKKRRLTSLIFLY